MSTDRPRPQSRGVYRFEVKRTPYALSEEEKAAMRTLFARVMAPLAFRAKPNFVELLFDTSLLVRAFTVDGTLAAFGNIRIRESGGKTVRHLLSVYVDPAHRNHHLSVRAVATALCQEAARNWCCLFAPLYVTGSAVNPMVVKSLAGRIEMWPDIPGFAVPPVEIARIAQDTASRYYPVAGSSTFQVGITPEVAEIAVGGERQTTGDPAFDRAFFEVARPEELRLLLFVGRVRPAHLMRVAVELAAAALLERAGDVIAAFRSEEPPAQSQPIRAVNGD